MTDSEIRALATLIAAVVWICIVIYLFRLVIKILKRIISFLDLKNECLELELRKQKSQREKDDLKMVMEYENKQF